MLTSACVRPPASKAVKSWIAERNVKRAVVVGAGFIGLEMAENFVHLGIETQVVEMGPQVRAGALLPARQCKATNVVMQHAFITHHCQHAPMHAQITIMRMASC